VATTDTGQAFAVVVAHEVELEPARDVAAELTLPAEALCRLVYGRLDPAHTPPGVEGDALDFLRGVFGGV
ncbi:MAG: hypothetical protein ACRDV0_05700, partial [Acidimicrobiales bacterium]